MIKAKHNGKRGVMTNESEILECFAGKRKNIYIQFDGEPYSTAVPFCEVVVLTK